MICFNKRIDRAAEALKGADFILVGAGAGLSAAAGLTYDGERFTENFAPFISKYGFTDMYTSGFYPFKTEEERWAYWSKHIKLNRFDTPALPLYTELFTLVKDKSYFVITTNVDSQFDKADFPKDKIFEVQGNYGFLQCAKGCHNKLYYNEKLVDEMTANTEDCKIPTELVPKCHVCGGKMNPHLRSDNYFVENEGWHKSNKRYEAFMKAIENKNTVFLELGVGYNTPGIIRFPFEQMTYENERATLIRLNRQHPDGAKENVCRTISFTEAMQEVITLLCQEQNSLNTL